MRFIFKERISIIAYNVLVCVFAFALIALQFGSESPRIIWLFCGSAAAGSAVILNYTTRLGWLSPFLVYCFVFWLFHFGLVFPLACLPTLENFLEDYQINWLDEEFTQIAVVSSLLYICTFTSVAAIFADEESTKKIARQKNHIQDRGLLIIGTLLVVFASIYTVFSALQMNFSLSLSYLELFGQHNNVTYGVILVGLGLIFRLAGGADIKGVIILALSTYLPLAMGVFLVGIRTGPLFSFVALCVAFYMRGLRVPKSFSFLGIAAVLMLISIVRETRTEGFSTLDKETARKAWNPAFGVMELGGSLRPVSAVVKMHHEFNTPYGFGSTYIWPIQRQLMKMVGMKLPGEWEDFRFIASHVNKEFGSIGFSTVAEAYYNGGALCVILFSGLWAALLAMLFNRANSPFWFCVLAAVFLPMLINIRNSFIYVPAWIAVGLILVLAAKMISKAHDSN